MNLIAEQGTIAGIAIVLFVALAIAIVSLVVFSIVALVLKIKIFFAYWVTNRADTSGGYTGATAARKLLDDLGYNDIKVEKIGFFAMLFFGNHYNPKRKTIYLRKSVYNKKHLTAIGLALQKVGLVIQDKRDGDAYMRRWKLQKFAIFSPVVFIPIVLVGLLIDLLIFSDSASLGICTLITSIVGFIYFLIGLVLSFRILKTESKANDETLQVLASSESNFLNPEEQSKVAKVFRTYKYSYICDFIFNLLEVIKVFFQILLQIFKLFSKNKN